MFRALLALAVACTALATTTPAAMATKHCVSHGLEIRNLEGVTCKKASSVVIYFRSYVQGPAGWTCQRTRGLSFWRGYCEASEGDRYFTWRPLS